MKKGFTLIELIVVMVMIALLVGILLPARARGREEARKTQCRSNMRQLYMAAATYVWDNGGCLPALSGWETGNSLSTNDDDEQTCCFMMLTIDVEEGNKIREGADGDELLTGTAANRGSSAAWLKTNVFEAYFDTA